MAKQNKPQQSGGNISTTIKTGRETPAPHPSDNSNSGGSGGKK